MNNNKELYRMFIIMCAAIVTAERNGSKIVVVHDKKVEKKGRVQETENEMKRVRNNKEKAERTSRTVANPGGILTKPEIFRER